MKKPPSNAGVGASSIMLIIVVLCLTLFGVLSYVTARNDHALSERTRQSAVTYYEADAAAQRAIMCVDEWIAGGMAGEPGIAEGTTLTRTGDTVTLSVKGDEAHTLSVVMKVDGGGYTLLRYSYENTAAWSADTAQELFGAG